MTAENGAEPVIAYVAIHGIGRQQPGETAEDVADSVIAACSAAGVTFTEQRGESAVDGATRVGRLTTGEGTAQLRFIDAWWDGDVTPPPPNRVLRWMLRVTPFTVFLTLASWIIDLETGSRMTRGRLRIPMELLGISSLAVALVLTPLLMLVLLIANVTAVLRPNAWPRFTNVVLSTFGDAWLYRSDELDHVVLPRLTQIVERARRSADAVVLVGHSQGAEIGRRVSLNVPVDACVWVGGALTQLAITRTLRRSPVLPYVLWAYVLIAPLLISLLTAVILQAVGDVMHELLRGPWALATGRFDEVALLDWLDDASDALYSMAWVDLPWMLACLAFMLVSALLLRAAARWPSDLGDYPECSVLEVKSLADPVCFGSLRPEAVIRFVPIRSGRGIIREHVGYFEKLETGYALLEPIVGSQDLPDPYVPRFGFWTQACSVLMLGVLIGIAYVLGSEVLDLVNG